MQSLNNRTTIRWLLWFGALILFVYSQFLFSEVNNYEINWKQLRLSVSANNTPLAKILTEIAIQTGLEVRGLPSIEDTVIIDFSNLSLREGLQKLLVGKNYFIIDKESPDGTVAPGIILILNSQTNCMIPAVTEEMSAEIDNGTYLDLPTRLSRLEKLMGTNAPDLKESLYAATKDSEPMIRELAYRELYQRGDTTVLDILRRDARGEDIDVRRTALEILPELDKENAIIILSESVSDSSVDIRQKAFEKLSKMETGLDIIKEKLHDPDPDVRIAAIEILASLGERSARSAIEGALHDADERVRAKAETISQELQAMQASR